MRKRLGVWKRLLACVCAAALLGGMASAVGTTTSTTVTRGAFVQALYRAHVANGGAAVESAGNPAPFSDVGTWSTYFEALCWAKGAGIAGGYAGGLFRPEQTITREQAAVMLYRYGKAADRPLKPASAQAPDGIYRRRYRSGLEPGGGAVGCGQRTVVFRAVPRNSNAPAL